MSAHTSPSFGTARRTELFDALIALFLDEGFAHLTLDDIAGRLRCSKSTLYTLAGSKEQLVRAATVQFFRQATDDVERLVADVDGARARITAYLSAVGSVLDAASDQYMVDLDAFAPARSVYEKNTQIAARRVQQMIAEGVASGEFRDVHAAFAADLASTMMVRIQQRRVRESTGLDDASAYRELAAILTAGINA
ncbi:TetR/AcrR family transcriptional regulator [Mycobacterium sp. CBMA293]|uniref:TetR/AcrR family transcriptional regulator n=1 Tax=unclassified Mycolicibacterium TaxID=2636767 RepID=UPI001321C8AF|nr:MULTISPECIES: TetR/AcrR family transcriptional regulator [unclassified Mycolicibacterium]MUL47275.1 TetR/AcrR family transcriptional regulator [Mycolicibacterium sp. CBMA 360]MUL96288.1 TetR/AcrR family transcriptional regulator [Mycolicibacterium sp. CBMA 230]MUM30817.1 TetR/AcrR family transcriptional regulator [Mycolicibacterium sp. CBMA 361]MUL61386.1 TetR/AcrR family transcriptional regulator [Mycolicibacterium sp. CBMA 335]MUL72121.1 TetR/AcrR family transcriptional regulator [Mycolic